MEHESAGLCTYKDNRYYFNGFSLHGYLLLNILLFYILDDEYYYIVTDVYFIDEMSTRTIEEHQISINNNKALISSTYKIILKAEMSDEGEVFKLILIEKINDYGFYYNE